MSLVSAHGEASALPVRATPTLPASVLTWECWNATGPNACHHHLYGVSLVSADDGWAAGELGMLLHWDGHTWTRVQSPTRNCCYDVDMLSSTDGWAAGSRYESATGWDWAILHWDGVRWTDVSPEHIHLGDTAIDTQAPDDKRMTGVSGGIRHWEVDPYAPIRAIDARASDDVWVAGIGGVLHWDGDTWTRVPVPGPMENAAFSSIAITSADDGWLAGWYMRGGRDCYWVLLRWNGSSWTAVLEQYVGHPSKIQIAMASPGDGWIVGDFPGADIYRWDGNAWTAMPVPGGHMLSAVAALSATEAWATGFADGQTVALRWDGAAWSIVDSPPSSNVLNDITVVPDHTLWAVGQNGAVVHWDGSAWVVLNDPSPAELLAVDVLSPGDTWAVGREDTWWDRGTIIMHWDGTTWTPAGSPITQTLNTIDMLAPGDGWAAGNGAVLHWDGSAWTRALTTTDSLYGLDALSASDVWAVGAASGGLWQFAIKHWDGSGWTDYWAPGQAPARAVSMVSATDGWLVGGDPYHDYGVMIHWDGEEWQWQDPAWTAPYRLRSVDMLSGDDGWTVGEFGLIMHWSGSNWSSVESPTSATLNSVHMLSATEGWIAGDEGTILHWDGSAWHAVCSPTSLKLNAVALAADGTGWIVGERSSYLRSLSLPNDFHLPLIAK